MLIYNKSDRSFVKHPMIKTCYFLISFICGFDRYQGLKILNGVRQKANHTANDMYFNDSLYAFCTNGQMSTQNKVVFDHQSDCC